VFRARFGRQLTAWKANGAVALTRNALNRQRMFRCLLLSSDTSASEERSANRSAAYKKLKRPGARGDAGRRAL
jgi:hypothetical protein